MSKSELLDQAREKANQAADHYHSVVQSIPTESTEEDAERLLASKKALDDAQAEFQNVRRQVSPD